MSTPLPGPYVKPLARTYSQRIANDGPESEEELRTPRIRRHGREIRPRDRWIQPSLESECLKRNEASALSFFDSLDELRIKIGESLRCIDKPSPRASYLLRASALPAGQLIQRARRGRDAYPLPLPSGVPDFKCNDITLEEFALAMDYYVGTKHSANAVLSDDLKDHFKRFQDEDSDFGWAYSILRPFWSQQDFIGILDFEKLADEDKEMRSSARDGDVISRSDMPPRRVWDLLGNRVLPWEYANVELQDVWPVSHSWVSPDMRKTLWTPINGDDWPVPVPRDVDLDDIRLELILYGAEYAWLDVLCLRQKGVPDNKTLRKDEWALDVPTIGYIYERQANVVTYLSGLGRPFNATPMEDGQHWLSRAWTLQEIASKACHIGGLRNSGVKPRLTPNRAENICEYNEIFDKVAKTIHFRKGDFDIFDVLGRMRTRHAEHGRDKVAGLAYILRLGDMLPCYKDHEDIEEAWAGVVRTIDHMYVSQLVLLFPEPGDKGRSWLPSWDQIMNPTTRLPHLQQDIDPCLDRIKFNRNNTMLLSVKGYLLDSCIVHGLDEPDFNDPRFSPEPEASPCRSGILELESQSEDESLTMVVKAHHQIVVSSQERLALIGTRDFRFWVVCRAVDLGPTQHLFHKVAVVTMPELNDRVRAQWVAKGPQWFHFL